MVESKHCKDCAEEIRDKVQKELSDIVTHRSMCKKCVRCDRLYQAKEALKKVEKIGDV